MTVSIVPTVNSVFQNNILGKFATALEVLTESMPLTSFDVHPTATPDEWLYKAVALDTRNFRRKIQKNGVEPYIEYSLIFNGTNDTFTLAEVEPHLELQNQVIQLISSGVTDISVNF